VNGIGTIHRFGHCLWQIGDVKVSRIVIALGLETSVERFLQRFSGNQGMVKDGKKLTLAKPTS
jgi:hypothetical protein